MPYKILKLPHFKNGVHGNTFFKADECIDFYINIMTYLLYLQYYLTLILGAGSLSNQMDVDIPDERICKF